MKKQGIQISFRSVFNTIFCFHLKIFIYSFKSILKFDCPFKTEWRHFRASELSTVLTELKQEFDQGPRGPPSHAFAKIRNLIFVGHHTCNV